MPRMQWACRVEGVYQGKVDYSFHLKQEVTFELYKYEVIWRAWC